MIKRGTLIFAKLKKRTATSLRNTRTVIDIEDPAE